MKLIEMDNIMRDFINKSVQTITINCQDLFNNSHLKVYLKGLLKIIILTIQIYLHILLATSTQTLLGIAGDVCRGSFSSVYINKLENDLAY